MCQLIETICVKDGNILHLDDHQKRMENSIRRFYDSRTKVPDLEQNLIVPKKAEEGWFKCRVVYSSKIDNISWEPYHVRTITSWALIRADYINYKYKLADRKVFGELIRKARTHDIIIVKNGFITDCSFANLLFRREGTWFTPSTPLLDGTQRNRLLDSRKIREETIRPKDLHQYDRMKLINAMLDIDSGPEYTIEYRSGDIILK